MNTSRPSKLPAVGTSIFTIMSSLSKEHQAINLAQGFPDFNCDPVLRDLVMKYMHQGMNQYAPATGIPELRTAIAALTQHLYQAAYDPDTEITITSGATEALFDAITALVHPGDEVIVIEPAYDSYVPAITLCGGIPRFVPLRYPDFSIDWDAVEAMMSPLTRILIINSPHNPSGAVFSANDISRLKQLVSRYDFIILSDEVYEHIIFDGVRHESMARHPELCERSIVVSSFGKSFHTTGWKVGYAMAPAHLMAEFRKVHQYVTFATSTPFQYAMAEYMHDHSHFTQLADFYQAKRDLFKKLMEGSRFELLGCAGTYFQDMNYSSISNEPEVDFARRLTIDYKVASIPLSVFYHNGRDQKVLRFCFAKETTTLERAAEILVKI
jgi:methionine transaminase